MNETLLRHVRNGITDDVKIPARSRRKWAIRIVLIALAVLVPVLLVVVAFHPVTAPTSAPRAFGIPDRLSVPLWANSVTGKPPGRVAVMFGGARFETHGITDTSRVIAVGPTGYRYTGYWWDADEIHLGEVPHLSPDGTQLAWAEKSLRIVDFATGASRFLPLPYPGNYGTLEEPAVRHTEVLAWSPDGRSLAIAEIVATDSGPYAWAWSGLGIIDVQTGTYRRLTTVEGKLTLGFAAAFSPDGQRIAYQSNDRLFVIDLNGTSISSTALKPGELLAGKGAWTPDGSAIAITVPQRCCIPVATNWTIRFLDANTGQPATGPQFDTITDATAIRVLGWATPTRAIVAAFRPERGTNRFPPEDRTAYGNVGRVALLALEPGKRVATIFTSPIQILHIDIADNAIAGGIVPSPPLPAPSAEFAIKIGAINGVALLVPAGISMAIVLTVRRRKFECIRV